VTTGGIDADAAGFEVAGHDGFKSRAIEIHAEDISGIGGDAIEVAPVDPAGDGIDIEIIRLMNRAGVQRERIRTIEIDAAEVSLLLIAVVEMTSRGIEPQIGREGRGTDHEDGDAVRAIEVHPVDEIGSVIRIINVIGGREDGDPADIGACIRADRRAVGSVKVRPFDESGPAVGPVDASGRGRGGKDEQGKGRG
jgi:hypothetical protein